MKSVDELKQEQYDLKAKVHAIIEYINSEEFFKSSLIEKELVWHQRAGMEVYLNALTNRIYCNKEEDYDS